MKEVHINAETETVIIKHLMHKSRSLNFQLDVFVKTHAVYFSIKYDLPKPRIPHMHLDLPYLGVFS